MKVNEIKTIGDILNAKEYLQHECYCPNEIYDPTGFGFELFYEDEPCTVIAQSDDYIAVITRCRMNNISPEQSKRIVVFMHDGEDIYDASMVVMSEHNIKEIKRFINHELDDGEKIHLTEQDELNQEINDILDLTNNGTITL